MPCVSASWPRVPQEISVIGFDDIDMVSILASGPTLLPDVLRSKSRLLFALLTAAAIVSLLAAPTPSGVPGQPLLSGAQVDARVLAIIDRSCRDCHSEMTQYPWYAYVAPISWWIKRDVSQGRLHLNLSRWNEYSPVRKQRSLSEIANQVKDREMPLSEYILMHRDAQLSEGDVDAIFRWTQRERARLIAESQR